MHSSASRPQILVAEDNETNRKVIMLQLQLLNVSAEAAPNGHEALQSWRSGRFALLLTDLHMPEMDGYALASAIRAEEGLDHRTPIVAITANAAIDQDARCRAAGIDACLIKPVRLAQLQEAIAQWLAPVQLAVVPVVVPPSLVPAHAEGPVDLRVLASLVGSNPVTLNDVLKSFVVSSAKARDEIQAAVAIGCAASLGSGAHRLKSAARSIGALRLGEICQDIESASRAAPLDQVQIKAVVETFAAELTAVRNFIQTRSAATDVSQRS
jgi:CheY-like chemotaxis protein/HPt (histidine-containing phosphotransfer) domain-containing protein